MSKHTPGPWEVVNATDVFGPLGGDSGDGMAAAENDGWQVASCDVGVGFFEGEPVCVSFDVKRANARLIAAAPELLDLAHEVLASATIETPVHLVKMADKAIRKIEEE